MSQYKNKRVTVVGLARSGLAAATLLKDLGASVWITDNSDSPGIRENLEKVQSLNIKVEFGRHSQEFILGRDLIVVSPGVQNNSQAIIWAEKFNIPIISEIELASSVCPATIIATSGTNGKTTVTTLIGEVLKTKAKKVFTLGNIGVPFSSQVRQMSQEDFVSLEVSSFQLERIKNFKPKVAVVLNITPDHLDRYKDVDEYLEAKKRIFLNQNQNDWAVLNFDDNLVRDLSNFTKAQVRYFSQSKDREGLNLNQLAVITVASIFDIPKDSCYEVFKNFKGVEHRLEFVESINGIEFINDSKATNVDSTVWALRNTIKPTVLIAGGRDKNLDYSLIANLIKERVKKVILIGEAKEKIRANFNGLVPIDDARSLEEAISLAYKSAKTGDCILLSPMCASFDMFLNYEERGKVFKEAVRDLKLKANA